MELLSQNVEVQQPKSALRVLAVAAMVLAFLWVGRLFFVTLFSAILLAFILEPSVIFFMRFRLSRSAASFVVCSGALLMVYLAGLGLWTQAFGLWQDLPTYSAAVGELVTSASAEIDNIEKKAQELLIPKRPQPPEAAPEPPPKTARKKRVAEPTLPPPVQEVRIKQEQEPLVNQIYAGLRSYSDALLMASFVPFLVYFMLSWRDHLRRGCLSLFDGERRELATKAWEGVANAARAYVVGNFLLGLLLAVVSALFFWFAKLPYWQIVGPVSGFLSLIPYIGLPLALAPPLFAALPVYTNLTAYLIIATTVALFHLLALNLLYPKLVGGRVHLNPLVVTIALMLWYLLWGGAGLVLAIPITAGMKSVFDNVPSLRGYGRLLGD